jgi:phosphatidylserine/phosphatidylglycerophosphate/cardiolipin synthase-like enzyme
LRYIYIEDQYLVNLEVARALNAKLKEPAFEQLFLVIQDASATSDILIPNRKRHEFLTAVLAGLTDAQKKRVSLAIFDAQKKDAQKKKVVLGISHVSNEDGRHYHLGMHAKTLIVDDEIAIIGSANVNQRSFTCDSETSAVIYDDNAKGSQNFARVLRMVTWREYLKKPVPRADYEDWNVVAAALRNGSASDWFKLVKYDRADVEDLDDVIISQIKSSGPIAPIVVGKITGGNLQQTSVALSPFTTRAVFDTLWSSVIDPVVPQSASATLETTAA